MKVNSKIFIVVIFAVFGLMVFSSAQAAGFVPCDGPDCDFGKLIGVIIRVINFMIGAASLVAIVYIFYSAFQIVTAMGNDSKITSGKSGLTNAIIGFVIVLSAFVFVNFLIQTVFGLNNYNWWELQCAFNPDSACLN